MAPVRGRNHRGVLADARRDAPDVAVHQDHLAGVNAGSELGAGRVPVPAGLAWTVLIAIAGLVTLVAYLPSPAGRRSRDRDMW